MITNPDAVTVLCYGDSNTYGAPAEEVGICRWPVDVRWTGQLQNLLGPTYAVIEEGLRGRTTAIDYPNLERPGRNGLTYLGPCLHSHDPVDVVVVMLGTNDMKTGFRRSAAEIAQAIDSYVNVIGAEAANRDGGHPGVLLVSPPHIDDSQPEFATRRPSYDRTSAAKSRQLAKLLQGVAKERGTEFVDAAPVTHVGADGVHLARDSHRPLAELLADTICSLTPPGNVT
ncbi:MAG: GDSL-type esterase/lipase family protein, partial [Micromonosporaceae bacterium]